MSGGHVADDLTITPIDGLPEFGEGDDIVGALLERRPAPTWQDGDVVVVTSKIVSKVEGRRIEADDREQAITD